MKAGIELCASAGTFGKLPGLIGHRINIIKAMQQFTIGTWKIKPFDNVHDAAEPLSFLLASGDDKVLFIADTGYVKYRFSGITHIMTECNHNIDILRGNVSSGSIHYALKKRVMESHMSLETLLTFLKANDLRNLKEIHLLHLSDSNSSEQIIREQIEAITPASVIIAEG